MMFWVYIHTNNINGKMYVGITTKNNPAYRWGKHGEGYIYNEHFWSAIQKYGWDNFSHEYWVVDSEEAMKQCEKDMIAFFNTRNPENGYNLTDGGDGTLGYHHTDIFKSNQSMLKKTMWEDPEYYAAHSGENHWNYGNHGENSPMYNKHLSDSSKKAISVGNKGKKYAYSLDGELHRYTPEEIESQGLELAPSPKKGKHYAYGPDGVIRMYTQEEIDAQSLELRAPCRGTKGKKRAYSPNGVIQMYTLEEINEQNLRLVPRRKKAYGPDGEIHLYTQEEIKAQGLKLVIGSNKGKPQPWDHSHKKDKA